MLHRPTIGFELVHRRFTDDENAGSYGPNAGNTGSVLFGVLMRPPRYDSQFQMSLSLFIEPEKSMTIATSRGRCAAVESAVTAVLVIPSTAANDAGTVCVIVTSERL